MLVYQDALKAAQEMETKLSEEQEVCNGTMQSLWEECKPCLKNTCIKYYSRTCSSGAGLVGRQVPPQLHYSTIVNQSPHWFAIVAQICFVSKAYTGMGSTADQCV